MKIFQALKMASSRATVGKIFSLLACLFTSVTTLATINPSQALSNALPSSRFVNTTFGNTGIDPRFHLKAVYAETQIPLTPCFMNAVELLSQYAELDWLGEVRSRHGVVLPEYPQVEFAVIPAAPARSIEVRLVVWGIWVGIRDIINRNMYYEAEYEILWENQVVAFIYITKPMDLKLSGSNATLGTEEPLSLLPSPDATISNNPDTSHNSSTNNSSDSLNDDHFSWRPRYAPRAQTLTVVEVFLTVMAGLKNAAPHPALEKVPGPYASSAVDIFANVQFYIYGRRHPRPKPPFFQYIHVIKALRLVPGYMLQEKRFAELIFTIDVNGITVGDGYLQKGHYVPPILELGDLLGPVDDVALS